MESGAECQSFPLGYAGATTAPGMLPTFKIEGGSWQWYQEGSSAVSPHPQVDISLIPLVTWPPLAAEAAGMGGAWGLGMDQVRPPPVLAPGCW